MKAAFIPLHDAALSKSYLPLVVEDSRYSHGWIIDAHRKKGHRSVHALGLNIFSELTVTGRGHLFHESQLLSDQSLLPHYWFNNIKSGILTPHLELQCDEIVVSDPCVVFAGHGGTVYGHVLLEMLLRLQLLRLLDVRNVKFLAYKQLAGWVFDILKDHFGVSDANLVMYDRDKERVTLKMAIVPTQLSAADDFHPGTVDVIASVRRLYARPDTPRVSRVILSRELHSNPNSIQRLLLNAREAWELARTEFGFSIVHPEQMSWAEQVAMFSEADVILGEYGSAMHNAIFSSAGTLVMCVDVLNLTQSAIGAVSQHRQAFFTSFLSTGDGQKAIDLDLFRQWLRDCLPSAEVA